ncbi:MAG TPA: UMP kinase [Planctomycetota bacterium]|nr:UMP kinase [Planctomycetota bacterium]
MPDLKYRRILLKLSGEALGGAKGEGIDSTLAKELCRELVEIRAEGVRVAIVVGGGNIIRGATKAGDGIKRTTADYMGMLATMINAMALQDLIEAHGVETRVMSAIVASQVCEPYIRRKAMKHLSDNRIVILAGGTGNPFFTTDTAAALRAMELEAEILLKATKVDGIYSADPVKHKDARKLDNLTYEQVLKEKLHVMDYTAITLCQEYKLPIFVFNQTKSGNIRKVVHGEPLGTLVTA